MSQVNNSNPNFNIKTIEDNLNTNINKKIITKKHKKKNKRCNFIGCNKKLGLTDFKCKCELFFCSLHRLPEVHECSYDYKTKGRETIIKNNPLIICDKVIKI